MSSKAVLLKEDGNRHFHSGDYVSAEALYSKAIIADPTNPSLYTNRAMARLKMNLWESAIADCNECLKLSPDNMKAHYYLAQAHLELHDYYDAVEYALRAYDLCVKTADKSLSAATALVLRCKKERWEHQDKQRRRETRDLEDEVLAMMERERDAALRGEEEEDVNALGDAGGARTEIEQEWERKMERMRTVFDKARAAEEKRRKVPDWAIDDISFGFMHDPVITKTGKSYERSSIMEHLRRSNTDPLTREPLYISELRPNLDLKQACDEFLQENGWAVDW
ncbi:U-box domain-containing protein [Echria macrotheca]|uniref:U-box domain-containing protein n=1 Tax=Echria macrotheca TaxID=438768 RepID=A0AAJ0B8V8_9PEZI|nr:U-box domain-containing protein [Echria macrotheca]